MLENWQVERFKSIVDPYDFALADLTLLTGLNNTGKSSLLQSIVLIAQTLRSNSGSEPLLFQKPMLDLGSIKDNVNDVTLETPLSFHFTLSLPPVEIAPPSLPSRLGYQPRLNRADQQALSVTVSVEFGLVPVQVDMNPDNLGTAYVMGKSQEVPRVTSFTIVVHRLNEYDDEVAFIAEDVTPPEETGTTYEDRSRHQGHFQVNGQKASLDHSVKLSRFLPVSLKQTFVRYQHSHHYAYSTLLDEAHVDRMEEALKRLRHFFSKSVRYLGVPRSYAPMSPLSMQGASLMDDVGSHGEFAATVYRRYSEELIDWYDPLEGEKRHTSLAEAVDFWLQYLELAHMAKSERVFVAGRDGFGWSVAYHKNHKRQLLSAGNAGVSQALPLLVMGLLAPEGALLLVEYPELCLHQRAQARLGDFFVNLARRGKQCLIETHSENLVTQLRYHIVREGGHDPDKYMIYFAERDGEAGTQFTPIEISPRGNILNWPEGFFDETSLQEEHMSLAYLRRKAGEARKEQPHR